MNWHKDKKIYDSIMNTTTIEFDKDQYDKLFKHSPSIFDFSINFISEYDAELTSKDIHEMNKRLNQPDIDDVYINRNDVFQHLCRLTTDTHIAILIEAGIFEYTLVYIYVNNISYDIGTGIYLNKYRDIVRIFELPNKYILKKLHKGEIHKQKLAFLTPQELDPKKWKEIIAKQELIKNRKNNIVVTDIYKCKKCGERKCTISEMQTRGADESTTIFICCVVCGNRWRH